MHKEIEKPIKLNLGSGFRYMNGYINIDVRPECKPDLLCDVTQGLPFDDNSVEEVRAVDFLEHIPMETCQSVIEEIWRVLVPGGRLTHSTPSTDGRGAFQDPTHRSFWNINTWMYYMDDAHRGSIGTRAKFYGANIDSITNPEKKIIHTKGTLYAHKNIQNSK